MRLKSTFFLVMLAPFFGFSQNTSNAKGGVVSGNIQVDAQLYQPDSSTGAVVPKEKVASNSFVNLNYQNGVFTGGLRYEAYLPALQGFSPLYDGTGIPYRYARVDLNQISVTLGNFYDQFGSGIVFRSYEERGLGYDNAMDGIHVLYKPNATLRIKALTGKQRKYFTKSTGTVRAIDAEIDVNSLLDSTFTKNKLQIGLSFVSKYQLDNSSVYNLPENVGALAGRTTLSGEKYRFFAEYAYKVNDPSSNNEYIYKSGNAFIGQFSYFTKGFGFSADVKRIDNMSFRSEREATLSDVLINFSPSFTRQHTYNLLATLYPYATQLNGEIGGQFEVQYKFKKATTLGGKYGTAVLINYSFNNGLDTTHLNDLNSSRLGYASSVFGLGTTYFKDFNIEVDKKISEKTKVILTYVHLEYNKDVLEGKTGFGIVKSNIGIADVRLKLKAKHTLRTELQALFTQQDQGNWATLLLEYTYSPHWFFALMDQYNYGNAEGAKRLHYFIGSVGYTKEQHRIALTYGRQRAGIFCVGGVCRTVPAATGLSLSVSTNF